MNVRFLVRAVPVLLGLSQGLWASPPCDSASKIVSEPRLISRIPITELDTRLTPWKNIEALDEQPIAYIGASPREMALAMPLKEIPHIPAYLKALAESELQRLRRELKLPEAQFEIWPTYDNWGYLTWFLGRYRPSSKHAWKWLDDSLANPEFKGEAGDPTGVVLPEKLNPKDSEDWDRIFTNIPKDLYQRPLFGSIVWTKGHSNRVVGAWLSPQERENFQSVVKETNLRGILAPPPARFNESPTSFTVHASKSGVKWDQKIEWTPLSRPKAKPLSGDLPSVNWPDDFNKRYFEWVKKLSGDLPITSPLSDKIINFGKLGIGEKDNQIRDLVFYLKKYYEELGLEIEVQDFAWRGVNASQLIAKINGTKKGLANQPVIFSDHIDKAIAEDIFEKKGIRVSNPGADDNATASATLLLAADILKERYKDNRPENDIWFVHFTGEEYPGSCLGSRHLISGLLREGRDVTGNINLDMLGHRTKGDRVFQINPGSASRSWKLAEYALHAAKLQKGGWDPTIRYPWSRQSFITQTDSTFFDLAGYPTILINEHMNLSRRVNPYYHQSTDRAANIDVEYAAAQARTAILTGVLLSERQ
jgi:hypothetical protein